MKRKLFALLLATLTLFTLPVSAGCGNKNRIVITLSDGRTMTAELYPDVAPITVENFFKLVDEKFYDGVIFHRVIENFMVQTGGFKPNASGGYTRLSSASIKGEFLSNGVENTLLHEPGVLSMARTSVPDSASSQFFICVGDCSRLDGDYAAFGRLVDEESLAVAEAISKVPTEYLYPIGGDVPVIDVVISSIRRK